MSKLMFTLALTVAIAAGAGSAFAEEDPIAAAAAKAVEQVAQVTKNLPEETVKAVEKAEAAKNPPPTEAEMKNDAGVQTVVKMQDEGKFPSEEDAKEDAREKTAKEQVEAILRKNKIDWKDKSKFSDRIIIIDQVDIPTTVDPAKDKKFFIKRDLLAKALVLKVKGAVAESVGTVVSAEDKMRLFGGVGTNQSLHVESKFESVAKWPLFGVTVIAQAESWDGKKYSMAAAAVWSKVLHRAAKATLLGQKLNVAGGSKTLDQWLSENDLAFICGPRQIVDPQGNRVFLGVSAREIGRGSMADMASREAAKRSALSYLVFSLFSDVEQCAAYNGALDAVQNGEKEDSDATETVDMKIAQRVDNRVIAGASEIHSAEVVNPLSGKKIYVSVYSLDQNSAANARVMAEELIATRVATELANKRALGRLQGYQDQINKAKANTEEFEKGRAEGNAAIEKNLAPKNRKVSRVAAPEVKKDAKSTKGTFSGEGSISNDF